ncbi:MAG: hypothetical protein Kow0077_00490 [Anaerolineae bacterium]
MIKRATFLAIVILVAVWGVMAALADGEGDPTHGAELYASYCMVCHGPEGQGRAEHPAFAAPIRYDVTFEEIVADGVPGTAMFGWSVEAGGPLSMEDIADLRAFVQGWVEEGATLELPAPEVPEGLEGAAAIGAGLYATNCAACHGPEGAGRGGANFPPIGEHVDVLAIARRGVRDSVMPPFAQAYGGPLTDEELASIAVYANTWERVPEVLLEAEQGPKGAALLILLIGLGAVGMVAGMVLTTRQPDRQ